MGEVEKGVSIACVHSVAQTIWSRYAGGGGRGGGYPPPPLKAFCSTCIYTPTFIACVKKYIILDFYMYRYVMLIFTKDAMRKGR